MTEIVYLLLIVMFVFLVKKVKQDLDRALFEHEVKEKLGFVQEELKKILVLRVEKRDDVFYIYNQVTQEFVCQGKTLQEIREVYSLRFPDRRALVDEGSELLFKENIDVAKL
jgi:hypothetical protein